MQEKGGNVFWGEVNLIQATLGKRKCVFGVVRDVTERKRMEEELLRTQKLESLNLLAGGVAHDFNNILTTILSNLSMARVYGDLQEDMSRMLADAERASLRARNLTQQLLSFTKGGMPVRKTTALPRLLKETAEFTLSGSNVRCEFSIDEDLWLVEADEGQIAQVVQNLVINADQAMAEGGIIILSAGNVKVDGQSHPGLEPGRYVRISVKDQGIGIPDEYREKIFDPFFTTKQKGSGLGLTSCLSIVKNHDGCLQVDMGTGAETVFSVYLPASGKTAAEEAVAEGGPVKGEGRILLVDDDDMIRRSVGHLLNRLGYEVEFARDGREGIRCYKDASKQGCAFDLVIMDLTIPGGMGGKEAIQELRAFHPDAKVIASSGYASEAILANYQAYGFRGYLRKPYKIKEFSEVIHRIISGGDE